MRITDVDMIQTHPKNQTRNRDNYAFYGQLSQITVYRVTTDDGLVGYGETRGPMPARAAVSTSSAGIPSTSSVPAPITASWRRCTI